MATTEPDRILADEGRSEGTATRFRRLAAFVLYAIGLNVLLVSLIKGSLAPFDTPQDFPEVIFAGMPYFISGFVFWWMVISFVRAFLKVELEEFGTFLIRLFVPKWRR